MIFMVALSYHLLVLLLPIPLGFLALVLLLFVMIRTLMISLILIFRFDLENSNLFVTRRLVSFGVYYEVITLPQVLH